ncbi:MAG: sporulation protein YqfD [Clostridia bacterium]|nr:sporulation protein YqfD [Clostridia bacterium]MBR6523986.1 sporulation protein YqfD [Clostridia bacterium]
MSVSDILGYIRGYVVIRAEGCFLERFLNICMRRGILLRNVKRRGDTCIDACISIQGFKALRQIAKKTKTRVTIKSRHGLPFFLYRYRKRRPVIVGLVLFAAVLWYLSTHIMGIDIVGNERIPTAEIERGLKAVGLYRGAATGKIEPKSVQNKMMTGFDDIAWIGINIKGSRAYIEVKERIDTKRIEGTDIPCNLVAARDGIIRLLEVKEGQTIVKINDMVEKGDLLVSGAVDSTKDGIRYAHSFGEVYADTRYQKSRTYPLEYTEKLYTGEETKRISLTLFGKEIKLFLNKNAPYEYCDKAESKTEYGIFGGKIPSVFVSRTDFKEYVPEKKTRTLKQAVDLGRKELEAELKKEIPPDAEVKDVEVTYTESGSKAVEVAVKISCTENIAVQSVIDKIENMNYNDINENT